MSCSPRRANNFSPFCQLQTVGSDHLEHCVWKDSEDASKLTRDKECCH